ncbi:MAG TPA: hypothetical protein VI749_09585 [Candidatus Omnitrophota bacterium]|nr:hypothetical protein [Candidatus Omnitrophota bacterium]
MKERLERELKRLRAAYTSSRRSYQRFKKGCLVKKTIKGRPYYYLAQRQGKKVFYTYRGKLGKREIERYEADRCRRKDCSCALKNLREQIVWRERLMKILQRVEAHPLDLGIFGPGIIRLEFPKL